MPLGTNLSASLAQKIALVEVSRESVTRICVVTHTYHVIKNCYRQVFLNHCRNGNTEEVARITVEVMKAGLSRFRAMI